MSYRMTYALKKQAIAFAPAGEKQTASLAVINTGVNKRRLTV